ncbi:hypothetical protein MKX03_026982 [Papaver bracteatum]|nr:hypothetical protein MKX03_026982 [Papaver bracteatum]
MRDTARKDMRDGARRERPSKDLRDRARLKPNQSIFPDLNLHPSSSNTSFTNDRHPPPTHPPTIAYCSPSKIITACWSLAPPFTISDIGIKSLSSLSQSSSSKGQENLKTTTTNLPTTELSLEVGDRRQLLGFPNEKHNQHHQYGGNHNMMIRDETVRLDFEIGPCSEDDLDLELRLGFS